MVPNPARPELETFLLMHDICHHNQGTFGAIVRSVKGIPPCVWVVNEHSEDILVIVSKYRPNRILSGGGVNVSTTGVGLDLSSTVSN